MCAFDVKALQQYFKQTEVRESFVTLYQCLGFITAVASSPDPVRPSEWIKQLVTTEDKTPKFTSDAQAKEFSSLLIEWWSRCATLFDHGGKIDLPDDMGLTATGKANKSLVEFSEGYLAGYDWLSKTWKAMLPEDNLEANRSLSILTLILARFVNEKTVSSSHPEIFAELPNAEGCFKVLPGLLSAVGMLGKDLSTPNEARSSAAAVPARNEFKSVGRNEPCPCGSGKKFKKCCLH